MWNNIRGVVFDCDGVLFESRRANLAYYNTILAHFGQSPVDEADHETVAICHTAASPEVFRHILGEVHVAAALDVATKLHYRQFIPWMDPEPGLFDLLHELSATHPLAVATNRGSSMSEILCHFKMDHFFKVVVTSRDVDRPKPHADMLFLAAKKLEMSMEELLFVGDSVYDKMAAESAGMNFMAYKPQFTHSPCLTHHHELAKMLRTGNCPD